MVTLPSLCMTLLSLHHFRRNQNVLLSKQKGTPKHRDLKSVLTPLKMHNEQNRLSEYHDLCKNSFAVPYSV